MSTNLPADVDLEASVLACLILHPEQFDNASRVITSVDWYKPAHAWLHETAAALHTEGWPDIPAVMAAHRRAGHDPAIVEELITGPTPSTSLLIRHCEQIAEHAAARRLIHDLGAASSDLVDGADPTEIADRLAVIADRARHRVGALPPDYLAVSELVARSLDTPRPWVLPGLLRAEGRCVVVAREGQGKSTTLRQVAVCAAAGIHPFTGKPIRPVRVLVVDLENDHTASAQRSDRTLDPTSFAGLVDTARRRVPDWDPDAWLRIWTRPTGIDLRASHDRAALESMLADHRPDLVVGGPIYKLHRRRPRETDEEIAADLQGILDRLRERWHIALILEHHAAKGDNTSRTLDPFGSSLWLRWPDLGIRLDTHRHQPGGLKVGRFRGDRYPVRWPDTLHRGGPTDGWPWVGRYDSGNL